MTESNKDVAKTTSIQIDILTGGFLLGLQQSTPDGNSSYSQEILVTERKLLDRIKSLLKQDGEDGEEKPKKTAKVAK